MHTTRPTAHHQPPGEPETRTPGGIPGKTKPEGIKSIISTIAIILIAPAIALFLTAFVFQAYQVEGQSMETTLQNNDRLIVWKVSRSWARMTGHSYIPKRGDVVVFSEPTTIEFNDGNSKQLIKRVIGLPGERVTVKNGIVTVYNSNNPKGIHPDETLPYGSVIENTPGELNVTVPKDHIYVMGDNRNNSLDSRIFGPIEANSIAGKLISRVLPLGNAQRF